MIRRVKKAYSKREVLSLMEPLLAEWFDSKFKDLTEPQSFAVPLIHKKKNVLVSSPTGSGKTLTAFLSIINELLKLEKRGRLEDKIYCVYISPLKALANDINKNLTRPLMEMEELAQERGYKKPGIRTAIRHGDTSQSERQRMSLKPPHIFITTPETLSIVLSTPKFRHKFNDVKYVIVDEIHEVCSNKRGAHLSLTLERLQECTGTEFVRIGLSATIAPINEIARFLVGFRDGKKRKTRDAYVVEVEGTKRLDIKVMCPVEDILSMPSEIVNSKMYELLGDMIEDHRTTLIFTNTRSGTEKAVYKLKERGLENIEAHHGSLSKSIRLDVEDRLKNGELKATVSSTSLELGIDIGHIDLVCQISSPKSIAKGLQRVGRAGHAYGDISKGRIIVFDNDDLIECATLTKNAYDNKIDRVDIPSNCLDVLAQSIIGMSLERKWDADEAYELIRRSYSFRKLTKKDFLDVLEYLSSREPEQRIYSKIWFDRDENVFGRKRGSRMIYYTNVGTIPEEGSYTVVSERGAMVGQLSEKFVEHLSSGDVFVLGGKPYQFERCRGMRVYAKRAEGRRPTVPSWAGEMLPRSFDLALEVGRFRGLVLERLRNGKEDAKNWLMAEYRVDRGSANSIIKYLEEQQAVIPIVPTDKDFLIEGYRDLKGNRNMIFHYCLGRRVNDALSRAYAYAISKELNCSIKVSVTDDNFMLTAPKHIALEKIPTMLTSKDLEETLRMAVRNTELFKQRFRHCATRSFMILRNYKGHEISIGRQQLRSSKVLDYLHRLDNFPAIKETYNEIQNDVMDLKNAKSILQQIEDGKIKVHTYDYADLPSPLAHNVVLLGISDMVLMEDRSAMLRELHRQVLRRIMPDVSLGPRFETSTVRDYFEKKFRRVEDKNDLKTLLGIIGPVNLYQRKGTNIYQFSNLKPKELSSIVEELVKNGEVQSIYTPRGIRWTLSEDIAPYASVYARTISPNRKEKAVLELVRSGPRSTKALSKELKDEPKEVLKTLKRLESAFEVHRIVIPGNEALWSYRKIQHGNVKKALRKAILQRLELGPLTLFELSYHLDCDIKEVEPILDALEKVDLITKENFHGEEHEQYILTKDFVKLGAVSKKEPSGLAIEEDKIQAYLYKKQFNIADVKDYFNTFMDAAMPFDVHNHVERFDIKEWNKLREDANILQGRFVNGRVRHVWKNSADLLTSAYRTEGLNEFDKKVLKEIASSRGLTLYELVGRLKEDKEKLKESIEHLDTNLYIIRKFDEEYSTQNLYVSFEPSKKIDEPLKEVLLMFLKGYGPATVSAFHNYSSFNYDEIEATLKALESEGKVVKLRTEGNEEYYMMKGELEPLRKTRPSRDPPLRILSIFDPYVQPIRRQVASICGDRWVFPVVKGGELKGMVEKWEMSGCVEVREIDVDEELLDEVLKELDRVMSYYNQEGYDILRIVRALGRNIDELEKRTLNIFKRNGYSRLQRFLVKGSLSSDCFEKNQILAYVFWKQGLCLDRYNNLVELIDAQGGIRTNLAATLRLPKPVSPGRLNRLMDKGTLVRAHGVPYYLNYVTPNMAKVYKKFKSFRLREYEKLVLRVVEEEEPIARNRLIKFSPLGYGNTIERLKKLYDSAYLAKDVNNNFITIDNIAISRKEARKAVIKNIFQNFGIFSAENLAAYTKYELKMKELRAILKGLEDDGYLEKGYFINGDDTLYWALKSDLAFMGDFKFDRKFILPPDDNLWSYLQVDIRNQWRLGSCFAVFDGTKMVAAFKGRVRRGELAIIDFKGDNNAWKSIEEFAAANNLSLKVEHQKVEDWEIMTLYERIKGKVVEK